jgi:tRNA pseudouridine55 synthase
MAQTDRQGILLINKPRQMTSFGVVSRLRRLLGVRKIGHTGTLDPFAEGLLPICIGQATRAVQFMDQFDKAYQVRVVFGAATDTMDLDGAVIESRPWQRGEIDRLRADDFSAVRAAVAGLTGPSCQVPPMYSAVKIDGQPLYKLARAGQTIERQARPIRIDFARIDGIESLSESEPGGPFLALEMTLAVSKGTYIRVIADELGRSLGYFAHANRLVRTVVGPYQLEEALSLDRLEQLSDAWFAQAVHPTRNEAQAWLWQVLSDEGRFLDIESAFVDWPRLLLPAREALQTIQGQKLVLGSGQWSEWITGLQSSALDRASEHRRLAVHGPQGLIGVAHLEQADETRPDACRLVAERIFTQHERLLQP